MNTTLVELKDNGIHLEIQGIPMFSVHIPSDPVDRNFAANIKDHTVVRGDQLRNGMLVLVEERIYRGFTENSHRDRWALVTNLETGNETISFVGIYADGTMVTRTYNQTAHWAVMKNTDFIGPETENESLDRIDDDFFQAFYGGGKNSPESLTKFVENLFGPAPSFSAPTDLQDDEGPAAADPMIDFLNDLAEILNQKTNFLDNIDEPIEEPEEYPETVTSDESETDSK